MTLVEILVAVVLLGIAGVAMLTAMRISVEGTARERDHSKAHQWLQSAIGSLQATPRVTCDLGEPVVRETYQTRIRSDLLNPEGWADNQLTIVPPVMVWDGTRYWDPAEPGKACFDNDGFKLQLITIQVTNPNGEVIEEVQVVKDD